MAFVNFTIHSDFKWFLLGVAALWALSLVAFYIEQWAARAAIAHASPTRGSAGFSNLKETEHETS